MDDQTCCQCNSKENLITELKEISTLIQSITTKRCICRDCQEKEFFLRYDMPIDYLL